MSEAVVLSTRSSRYFADLIADRLGLERLSIERSQFSSSEAYYRIEINHRMDLTGKDAIFVGSTHTDRELLELYRVGNVLFDYGTRHRIFIIPFLGYSTMERAVYPGEVVTAKENARLLSSIRGQTTNTFLMLDLHEAGLVHYFEGDCHKEELYAETLILREIESLKLKNFVLASTDLGRTDWIETYANCCGVEDMAFISKSRNRENTTVFRVTGHVKDRDVVIYDDMIRSGSSLINAAEAYKDRGAKDVYALVSHLALNNASVVEKLELSSIIKIVATNSHPMSQSEAVQQSRKIVIEDVSDVFVQAIRKILNL
ncbi:MAG: ribose-phosphate diphosphokinase [Candidatus Bipolaricaulia bacterium]